MPINQRYYVIILYLEAAWIFGVFPIIQLFSTRSATMFLFSATVSVVLAALLSKPELVKSFLFSLRNFQTSRSGGENLLIALGMGLLAWSTISLFWSPLPADGAKDIAVVVLAVFAWWLLSREFSRLEARWFHAIYFFGFIFAMIMLVLDIQIFKSLYRAFSSNIEFFDLNRNATTLALLLWPALAYAGYKTPASRIVALLMLALCLFVIFSTDSQAAQLGVLTGLAAGLLTLFSRWMFRGLMALMILLMLVFPQVAPLLPSIMATMPKALVQAGHAQDRIAIWRGYALLIDEKPLTGWGMRAHRELGMNGSAGTISRAEKLPESTTTHPHNFILEIWVNLGVVGAILAAGILLALGLAADRGCKERRVVFAQLLTTGFVISATGHGFTQTWWIAAITIVAIAFGRVQAQPVIAKSG